MHPGPRPGPARRLLHRGRHLRRRRAARRPGRRHPAPPPVGLLQLVRLPFSGPTPRRATRSIAWRAAQTRRQAQPLPHRSPAGRPGRARGRARIRPHRRHPRGAQGHRLLQRLAGAAGIPDPHTLTPHAIRHSVATALLHAGEPLDVVQALLGHTDPRTTQAYLHVDQLDRSPAHVPRTGGAMLITPPTSSPSTADALPGTAPRASPASTTCSPCSAA
ncbi:tyrosine-type recombinase/integrase [Nonomuraea sp. NPDC003804]|uniref:tyrosine-type recombinase/integrase n=1 Tax=Nonomuraea sp. NPDC003804 TaxID=3154547 RepID=UPI0033A7D3D4